MTQKVGRLKEDNSSFLYSCNVGEFNVVEYKQIADENWMSRESMEGIATLDSSHPIIIIKNLELQIAATALKALG